MFKTLLFLNNSKVNTYKFQLLTYIYYTKGIYWDLFCSDMRCSVNAFLCSLLYCVSLNLLQRKREWEDGIHSSQTSTDNEPKNGQWIDSLIPQIGGIHFIEVSLSKTLHYKLQKTYSVLGVLIQSVSIVA